MEQSCNFYVISIPNARFKNFIVKTENPDKAVRKVLSYVNDNVSEFQKFFGKKSKVYGRNDISSYMKIMLVRTNDETLDLKKEYDLEIDGLIVSRKKIEDLYNCTFL